MNYYSISCHVAGKAKHNVCVPEGLMERKDWYQLMRYERVKILDDCLRNPRKYLEA